MKWLAVFLAGIAVGAGTLWLAAQPQGTAEQPSAAQPSERTGDVQQERAASNDAEAPAAAVQRREARVADAGDDAEVGSAAEWNALVGGMLEWQVEQTTGQRLPADKKARLLAQLQRLREASVALQEVPSNLRDPAEVRERLMQTVALIEADRAFQRELGMSVAEFLNEASSTQIEEVPLAPAER